MDSIPSRSMLHMKHEVFVWTDCSTWIESVARRSHLFLWYFFVFMTIHSKHKSKPIAGNCLPQWILKKLRVLSCGFSASVCSFTLYHCTQFFVLYHIPNIEMKLRKNQLQVMMCVILVVIMETEIIHVCCRFSLHSFIMFCVVNCHQASGSSE